MMKIAGSESGSISKRRESADPDPDPNQNVMDPEHWDKPNLTLVHIHKEVRYPEHEMEFLDISLTKDSSLLLYAIHIPAYWWIFKKTILLSGFKNTYKKNPRNKKTLVFSWKAFCRIEDTRVYAQKTRLKMVLKNSISVLHVPVTLICSLTARLSPPSGVSSTRKGRPPPSAHKNTKIKRTAESWPVAPRLME